MNLNYEITDKEKSQVLLKITINGEDVRNEYKKILNEAKENAQIPGFRKGRVPESILETKYKEGFLAETANIIMENAFKEIIEKVEKKPIGYSIPKIENFKLPELGSDFTFELIYDVFPSFKIDDYKNIEVEKDEAKISDDDINSETEKLVKDFSTIEPKDGKITDNDIVSLDYTVYHNDNEFYKRDNENIYIGKDYDMFKLGSDIIGMKKEEEKEFEKSFKEDEIEKIAGKTFRIKLKIKEVKLEKKPKLDDELAKQIDEECKTVSELKNKIKDNLQKYADMTIKQRATNEALKKIVDTYNGDIPESMITQQSEYYYQDIINRVGGNEKKAESILKMDNLNKEAYLEKMRENALFDIKKGLILQDIVKKENIVVNDDDIKNYIDPIAKQYKMEPEKFLKMATDTGKLEVIKNEIETKKAFDLIYDNIKFKKGKKLKFEDLINNNFNNI